MISRILNSLSRVTSSGRYVPLIDGLRFVAIMAVMLFHLNESLVVSRPELEAPARQTLLFHVLKTGNVGVPLFFAISGFILAVPFIEAQDRNKPASLGRYFLRRLTRLEPPYILNLLLITVLLVLVNKKALADLVTPLLASMGYVHNLVYGEMSQINCVAWSLEIEVQFYILMPLFAWLLLKMTKAPRRVSLLVIIGALIAAKMLLEISAKPPLGPELQRIKLSLLYYADYFLVGILLADIYQLDWRGSPSRSAVWDGPALACWILVVISQWHHLYRHLLPLIVLACYIATFRSHFLHRALSWKAVTVIGGMCYTLYLYHFFVISFVNKFTVSQLGGLSYPAALAIQFVCFMPAALLQGALLFWVIERPFMIWQPFRSRQQQSVSQEVLATS